jgi:hypothetical protein
MCPIRGIPNGSNALERLRQWMQSVGFSVFQRQAAIGLSLPRHG